MLLRVTILVLIICLGVPLTAQRTGKRVKERAVKRTEAKANNRIDQKIDRGVDKVFDSIEGLFGKKAKKNAPDTTAYTERVDDGGLIANDGKAYADDREAQDAFSNLLGLGKAEPFEPYRNETLFTLTMEVAEVKNNGRKNTSNTQLGASETALAMVVTGNNNERSQIIYSTEDGKTTTISTDKRGQRSGFRLRMPNFGQSVAQEVADEIPNYITFKETDEHRQIDGYDCRKIIVTDSKHGYVTTSWVTTDIPLTPKEVFGSMAGLLGGGEQALSDTPVPVAGLAILSVTDDGKKTTEMHLTNIRLGSDLDRSLFDTAGVEIQEL